MHQIPELLRTLEGDTEQMLPAMEDTLEDDSEVRARLRDQIAVVAGTEVFLVPFMLGILSRVLAMTVKEGNWVKSTK